MRVHPTVRAPHTCGRLATLHMRSSCCMLEAMRLRWQPPVHSASQHGSFGQIMSPFASAIIWAVLLSVALRDTKDALVRHVREALASDRHAFACAQVCNVYFIVYYLCGPYDTVSLQDAAADGHSGPLPAPQCEQRRTGGQVCRPAAANSGIPKDTESGALTQGPGLLQPLPGPPAAAAAAARQVPAPQERVNSQDGTVPARGLRKGWCPGAAAGARRRTLRWWRCCAPALT